MSSIQTLSVYLLKSEVKAASDALKPEAEIGELQEHAVEAGETTGTLFVQVGDLKQPPWVHFLAGATEPPIDDTTRRLNAVLVLEAAKRRFAITFGSAARFLLDPDRYERDFGLFCALNSVDPDQLRGAAAHTLEGNALYTLRQLTVVGSFAELEIDTERELLDALAGRLTDREIGRKVDGRDAARLTADVEPSQLKEKCAKLLAASKRKKYRDPFPFVDQIRRVKDPRKIRRLEAEAMDALAQRRFEEFDLFPPEMIPQEIVEFQISPAVDGVATVVEPDSSLLHYPLPAPKSSADVRPLLDKFRIRGIDPEGNAVDEWSFYRCLHWETEEEARLYVLDGGRWYEIDQDLAGSIEEFAVGLKSSGIDWPKAKEGQSEGDYNEFAAKQLGIARVDKRLVKLPGRSPIEPCDLFTEQRHLVHVKHRKGGSGPLSHLYAQAIVSAECFVSIPEFREGFKERLEEAKPGYGEYSPPEGVSSADYSIVLALIATPAASRGSVAKKLPFFSKVMLRAAVRRLEAMGFTVYLDAISTVAKRKLPAPAPAPTKTRKAKAPAGGSTAKASGRKPAGRA
jgi:uncharacterized protein (TIGR04141 family)